MQDEVEALLEAARRDIAQAPDTAAVEQLRVALLGKKGSLTALLKQLGGLPAEERKQMGEHINRAKQEAQAALTARREALETAEAEARLEAERIDVTLPGRGESLGAAHPISRTIARMEAIFGQLGFSTETGPEIEDDHHNFEALNIPPAHPARAMQDTFYVRGGEYLLRTHTSPVQVRTMRDRAPPIRIICPGRVYRVDLDRTHSPMSSPHRASPNRFPSRPTPSPTHSRDVTCSDVERPEAARPSPSPSRWWPASPDSCPATASPAVRAD